MAMNAQTTIVDELEADLQTPGYIVGPYTPALRDGDVLGALGLHGLTPLSEDERVNAVNLCLSLDGRVAHTLQDTVVALGFAGAARPAHRSNSWLRQVMRPRRLDALPTRAAQWDDAEVRTLREQLTTFDRAQRLTFLCQF
jgi:hypothetical protein